MLLLSLVTPVYNDERHLRRLLYSLRASVPDPRWELLVVDDASDSSVEGAVAEARVWGMRIQHFRLGQQSGPGAARNAGIALARGEFIGFVDVDDEVHLDRLLTVADAAATAELQAVSCNYEVARQGAHVATPRSSYTKPRIDSGRWQVRLVEPPAIWSWVFRRRALEANHIQFPETAYAEDVVFLLRLSRFLPTFCRAETLTYTHLVATSSRGRRSASSIAVSQTRFEAALHQLGEELANSPDWQKVAVMHWRLRISCRFLFSPVGVRFNTRVAAARALAGDIWAHPVLALQVLTRAAARLPTPSEGAPDGNRGPIV